MLLFSFLFFSYRFKPGHLYWIFLLHLFVWKIFFYQLHDNCENQTRAIYTLPVNMQSKNSYGLLWKWEYSFHHLCSEFSAFCSINSFCGYLFLFFCSNEVWYERKMCLFMYILVWSVFILFVFFCLHEMCIWLKTKVYYVFNIIAEGIGAV